MLHTAVLMSVPTSRTSSLQVSGLRELEGVLRAGDLIFTCIRIYPFRAIAHATNTWTNHVEVKLQRSINAKRELVAVANGEMVDRAGRLESLIVIHS